MKSKLSKIKIIAVDVDGVLTDGRIIYDSNGVETKAYDVQDGYALVLARRQGFKTAIITARSSPTVTLRADDLGFDKVYQNACPKMSAYEQMLKDFAVEDSEVCFIGDDLPDIPVLRRVGFAVAVRNAASEVRKDADHVTKKSGGNGAVREVIEVILKAQGLWQKILKSL